MATNNSWDNQVSSADKQIILNSGTNGVVISSDASASTVDIATGAAAKTTTIGSTNTTSSLDLKFGTADFTIASATGTVVSAADTGEINYPLQPAFLAYLASQDDNVTGAGTVYTIGTNVALTEVYDQNSDFNTNGTFTAPVTGRYLITTSVGVRDITSAMTFIVNNVVSSNRTYLIGTQNPSTVSALGPPLYEIEGSVIADMDASDTVTFQIQVSNGAGDTADVSGTATNIHTFFSGALLA